MATIKTILRLHERCISITGALGLEHPPGTPRNISHVFYLKKNDLQPILRIENKS